MYYNRMHIIGRHALLTVSSRVVTGHCSRAQYALVSYL